MLSHTPEISTPADEQEPDFGAPTRSWHSPDTVAAAETRTGGARTPAGRHRRVGAEPADKFLLDIPTPHRPTTLADSPPTYRAAFLTDDIPWSRPSVYDDVPRYRAARAADRVPRQRTVTPPEEPPTRPRRSPAPGRRRAQQDSAWDKATGAVHRAATGLTRRSPAATPDDRDFHGGFFDDDDPPGADAPVQYSDHGDSGYGDSGDGAAARARAIIVRPVPATRDALAEQLPAARRVAGAVRDWARSGTEGRPVTGSRRAPGTLPIENWLLIGRHRQQALLAALVAAGIALVMIPGQQTPDDVDAVNAADRSAAIAAAEGRAGGRKPGAQPAGATEAPQRAPAGDEPGTAPTTKPKPGANETAPVEPPVADRTPSTAPSATTPGVPAPGQTASGVSPDAHGPAKSLRRTGTETVALTFDDGPDPQETPKLLQLLADNQVTATFCLVGERAQAHPELVQQIVAAGHTLCNHSWDHSFTLGSKKPEEIRKDLEATDKAIRDAVPDVPIPYFRAPGGIFTDRLVAVADESGMKSLYWEVDPRDWDHTKDADDAAHVERVVAQVKKDVKPGSIVLSHDFNQPQTIAAYEQLLPYLTGKYKLGLP